MLDPFSEHPAFIEAMDRYQLCRDLLDGLPAMRAAQEEHARYHRWLPPYPHEALGHGQSYDLRVQRATLFAGFADAVRRIAAKPFRLGVRVTGLPDELEPLISDIDGRGTSLHSLGRRHFAGKVAFGVRAFLVDWTDTSAARDERGTVPVAVADAIRPYVTTVSPLTIRNWVWSAESVGAELAELHLREDRYEVIGNEVQVVEITRIIERDQITIHTRSTDGKLEQMREQANPLGEVPLIIDTVGVPDTVEAMDPMIAHPPLEGVAWLNLAHFQSQSMQRVALDKLRAITAYETGVPQDQINQPLPLGGAIRRTKPDANLRFVEPEGSGVEHGWRDLTELENLMERLGLQPLVRRSGGETATGRSIDEAAASSEAETWARATEAAIGRALRLAYRLNAPTPRPAADADAACADLSVDISSEFSGLAGGVDVAKMLLDSAREGFLPAATYLGELQARGYLRESVDIEKVAEDVEREAAERMALMATPEPEPEDVDDGQPPPPEPEA